MKKVEERTGQYESRMVNFDSEPKQYIMEVMGRGLSPAMG